MNLVDLVVVLLVVAAAVHGLFLGAAVQVRAAVGRRKPAGDSRAARLIAELGADARRPAADQPVG